MRAGNFTPRSCPGRVSVIYESFRPAHRREGRRKGARCAGRIRGKSGTRPGEEDCLRNAVAMLAVKRDGSVKDGR